MSYSFLFFFSGGEWVGEVILRSGEIDLVDDFQFWKEAIIQCFGLVEMCTDFSGKTFSQL